MSFTIRLLIWFKSNFVGSDSYGNRYYQEKHKKTSDGIKPRRWVVYNGNSEASKIPPEWHAWLHYRADQPLQGQIYAWQKPHLPNLTGTPYAYNPENIHGKVIELKTKKKPAYEPWKPNG